MKMLAELEPPIRNSVLLVDHDQWVLGSQIVCERLGTNAKAPQDALCFWTDESSTFILRWRTQDGTDLPLTDHALTAPHRVYDAGSTSAVWMIGDNMFCKVRSWIPGMALEADTIAFVRKIAPSVPVPNVIYSWVDQTLNRTFLLLERVPGTSLVDAWPFLSLSQRADVAKQITAYCVELAATTSPRFETATGHAIEEYHFAEDKDFHTSLSWKPFLVGPFDHDEYAKYLRQLAPSARPLKIEPELYFYHNDTGPTNIFVEIADGHAHVTGIIDWERAGYFPRFVISTRPRISSGYILGEDDSWNHDDRTAWAKSLYRSLEAAGFEGDVEGYIAWNEEKERLYEARRASNKSA